VICLLSRLAGRAGRFPGRAFLLTYQRYSPQASLGTLTTGNQSARSSKATKCVLLGVRCGRIEGQAELKTEIAPTCLRCAPSKFSLGAVEPSSVARQCPNLSLCAGDGAFGCRFWVQITRSSQRRLMFAVIIDFQSSDNSCGAALPFHQELDQQ
jgi:hypothetical protein